MENEKKESLVYISRYYSVIVHRIELDIERITRSHVTQWSPAAGPHAGDKQGLNYGEIQGETRHHTLIKQTPLDGDTDYHQIWYFPPETDRWDGGSRVEL